MHNDYRPTDQPTNRHQHLQSSDGAKNFKGSKVEDSKVEVEVEDLKPEKVEDSKVEVEVGDLKSEKVEDSKVEVEVEQFKVFIGEGDYKNDKDS